MYVSIETAVTESTSKERHGVRHKQSSWRQDIDIIRGTQSTTCQRVQSELANVEGKEGWALQDKNEKKNSSVTATERDIELNVSPWRHSTTVDPQPWAAKAAFFY